MFGVARHVVHHGHQQKHATLYSGNKKQDLVNLPCKPAYPISILRAAKAHFTPALIPTLPLTHLGSQRLSWCVACCLAYWPWRLLLHLHLLGSVGSQTPWQDSGRRRVHGQAQGARWCRSTHAWPCEQEGVLTCCLAVWGRLL